MRQLIILFIIPLLLISSFVSAAVNPYTGVQTPDYIEAIPADLDVNSVTATEGTFTTVNYTSLNPPISIDTSDLVPYNGADKAVDLNSQSLNVGPITAASIISGSGNTVTGANSLVAGEYNVMGGNFSFGGGTSTDVSSDYSFVWGLGATTNTFGSFVFGEESHVDGGLAAIGGYVTASAGNAIAMGTSFTNAVANSFGIGNGQMDYNFAPSALTMDGEVSAKSIEMSRRTTSNTAGLGLSVQAGGATAGATNKAGGSLTLKGGQSTGLGGSSIIFQTTPKGSTGTADNAYSTAMTITGNEIGVGTTPNVAYAVSISAANAGGLNSTPTMSNPTGSSGTREINILSGTFSDATPPGAEFVRGVKTSMYFSGAAGGYDHVVSGGYFEGGYVSMGFTDAFPGGGKHLAIGGMFSGYVMDYGMGAGNRFDDDLTQIGGWFTVLNTPAGTGAKNQLGAYFEYDSLVQTGKKLLFEGTINLSTKVATIGDSYLIFNSTSTDMDWYVDGTQVMNVDNDLLDVKTEVKAAGVTSDGTGKVVCVKSDGNLGTCTDAPNASGVCTCS